MQEFYIVEGENRSGPYDSGQLSEMASKGSLSPEDSRRFLYLSKRNAISL